MRVRNCTVCNAQGIQRAATLVATLTRLQWFECSEHQPEDHGAVFGSDSSARTVEPLGPWLARIGVEE